MLMFVFMSGAAVIFITFSEIGLDLQSDTFNLVLEKKKTGDARYTKGGVIVHCFKVTVHCCILCDAT